MKITGKQLNEKHTFAHIHTYGHNYHLQHLDIIKVQNPYTKEKTLELMKNDYLSDNQHNPTKPIPNTGFWFAPYNFKTNKGLWLDFVKQMVADSMGIPVELLDEDSVRALLADSLYRLVLGDNVRVLYINDTTLIDDKFKQPDNTYYIDWESLAVDYDVVYFTSTASAYLQIQGYGGYEMEQGIILKQCDYTLEPVNIQYEELPNHTIRGLFKVSVLKKYYKDLKNVHLIRDLEDDALIMVVPDFDALSEVFDYETSKFYYRGQDYILIQSSMILQVVDKQTNYTIPSSNLLSSKDVEFIKYRKYTKGV